MLQSLVDVSGCQVLSSSFTLIRPLYCCERRLWSSAPGTPLYHKKRIVECCSFVVQGTVMLTSQQRRNEMITPKPVTRLDNGDIYRLARAEIRKTNLQTIKTKAHLLIDLTSYYR